MVITPQEIRDRRQRTPFVPWRFVLNDGTSLEVPCRELVMPGWRDFTVGIPSYPGGTTYQSLVRVAYERVVAVEDIQAPPA